MIFLPLISAYFRLFPLMSAWVWPFYLSFLPVFYLILFIIAIESFPSMLICSSRIQYKPFWCDTVVLSVIVVDCPYLSPIVALIPHPSPLIPLPSYLIHLTSSLFPLPSSIIPHPSSLIPIPYSILHLPSYILPHPSSHHISTIDIAYKIDIVDI